MELVIEGDYFQVLGVSRAATSYELKRAYLDMRRAYEPSQLLTAATADLADDVKMILEIIEEAWEALRDAGRRERYRAALDARPPA
jgi:DnaJ-class molecular chaperone